MMSPRAPQISGDDLRWRAGLTLTERLCAMNLPGGRKPKGQAAAHDKIVRWRIERSVDIARTRDLAAILFDPPPWLRTFRAAYAEAARSPPSRGSAEGLLAAVEPVLIGARGGVDAAIRELAQGICPASEDARAALLASLEANLRERLYNAVAKTLVLELAVAGGRNVLVGESAEQRFVFFCECLADPPFARALLEQYPVLVRRIATVISNWEAATLALLSRLAAARQVLIGTFFDEEDPGPLMSVQSTGDTHRGGQAVHILHFEAGHRLVYKPRSVALESCFCDLVAWLNRNGCEPDLKEVRTLDEDRFGWMEFVEAKPCQTKDEIQRFFVRQGAQLVLGYILGGTDLHFENVIAHGEYPVLVDLESLFQTPLSPKRLARATALGQRTLQMSVMGTLLLPEPMFLAGDEHWIDLSALGYSEGQLTPFRAPAWRGAGTDNMRLEHRRLPMQGGTSLPEFDSKPVLASQNVELIVRGFCDMYAFVHSHAAALRSESGPLAAALGKPVRHVFRATAWYARLLDASHHPRFLEDAIVAETLLRNRLRAGSEDAPWLSAIEDAEVADLMAGNIPYFSSRLGERGRVTGSEETDLVFSGDGWSQCRARLQAMSEADLERQTWLVRVAMADLTARSDARASIRSEPLRDPAPDELMDTAARIGDRICDLAIMDGEQATWLVPSVADKKRLVTTVAGFDLYGGLPGIALFLGHLGSVTGDGRYGRVAAAAMAEAVALYKAADSEALSLGAYDGAGGFALALVHLARPLDRPQWIEEALAILRKAARRAVRVSQVDIISGQAGLLAAALAVHRHTDNAALIRGMAPLAKKLHRLGMTAPKHGKVTLPAQADVGVAHGRAGIGFALSRWASASGENSCGETAGRLIRSDVEAIEKPAPEKSAYDQAQGHNEPRLGWCRGVLGIALLALQGKNVHIGLGTAWFEDIADDIIANGTDGPLCLCHGALGQLEFLAAMAERGMLRDPQAAAAWRRQLLARLAGGDWVADEGHRLESPGLMLGLAGTGYSLLRAARSQSIPSVLTLTT
jgi:type 2 lantibiotic biosynthesis protein LanM